jgi:kynurenine formamidase
MCVPGCLEHVARRLSRRRMLTAGAAATVLAARPRTPVAAQEPRSFSRAVDLTLTTDAAFPTYFGKPQLEIEVIASYDQQKYSIKRWHIVEHTGTHIDAPFHFSTDGPSADRLPVESLVCPLCVIDIAARAASDADAQVTPDDLAAWEAANGPFPQGACVAMHSGWDRHVRSDKYRNADAEGKLHFPGFHVEAVQKLLEGGSAAGIAVDTLSLDFGASPDFATHYAWLPAGRWGLEGVTGLAAVPATGATLVAGAPKIAGATGGPTRVIALV